MGGSEQLQLFAACRTLSIFCVAWFLGQSQCRPNLNKPVEMISAVFLLSPKGKVLINRYFRDDVEYVEPREGRDMCVLCVCVVWREKVWREKVWREKVWGRGEVEGECVCVLRVLQLLYVCYTCAMCNMCAVTCVPCVPCVAYTACVCCVCWLLFALVA